MRQIKALWISWVLRFPRDLWTHIELFPVGLQGQELTFATEARRRQGTQQVFDDMDVWTDGWEDDGHIYWTGVGVDGWMVGG